MRKIFLLIILGAGILSSASPEIGVETRTDGSVVLEFQLTDYKTEPLTINGKQYFRIRLPGSPNYLERGYPDLPMVNRALIIPDQARMEVEILAQEVEVIRGVLIAPSKGNLLRTVDPELIPYQFSSFYNHDAWFPSQIVTLSEPFILRDFRGITVKFNPFQYNPRRKELRITKRLRVRIFPDGPGRINVKSRRRAITREFIPIYQNVFLNYTTWSRWDTLEEKAGRIFVITADRYYDEMMEFVEWNRQKGFRVKIESLSTIGNNQNSIKNAIQNEYNSPEGLTFVLLVGDGDELIPAKGTVGRALGRDADPVYAYCEGNDYYPDIIVGRVSSDGGDANNVTKQITRTKYYELTPMTGANWYHHGLMVGSAQGSPADSTRLNWQRDSLLNYNYTQIGKSYDHWGTTQRIRDSINSGVGLINYMGHGYYDKWSNGGGFRISDLRSLTNYWKLPVVISVACVVGAFNGRECYCEASVVAGTVSQPTGFLAHWGSSISQTWVPPTWGEMGAVRMLVNDVSNTAGGYFFNGACYMISYYGGGTEGVEMAQTWHIFGDPTVQLRTTTPQAITVIHDPEINYGAKSFDVEVVGVKDALCAIYYPDSNRLYGSGYTDGSGKVTIEFFDSLKVTGSVVLTVTAYNKIPYVDTLPITMPGVETTGSGSKTTFTLDQNPSSRASITYSIASPSRVRITLYDVQGRVVRMMEDGERAPGCYHLSVGDLESGIYFVHFQAGTVTAQKKLVLLR